MNHLLPSIVVVIIILVLSATRTGINPSMTLGDLERRAGIGVLPLLLIAAAVLIIIYLVNQVPLP